MEVDACAVSDKAGEQMFNYVENAPGFSGLRQRQYDRSDPIIRQIPVPVRRIDELIPEDAFIRLIKIDIEGGEYQACLARRRRCFAASQSSSSSLALEPQTTTRLDRQ